MKILDVLRGLYVRSPPFVQAAARPFVSLVPTKMKFGKSYANWRARISRAKNDPEYASEQHLVLLRGLLAKANAGSPFYRKLIDEAFGSDFDLSLATPADLRRLPVLDKRSLKQAGDTLLAVDRRDVDVGETSGSNGEPGFSFYLDKDRSPREMAFIYDGWSRIGFGEQDARASFRGFDLNGSKKIHDWDPALRELKLAVFPMYVEDAGRYLVEIDRRQIRYLYGYPSAIELFCRRLIQLDRRPALPILGILPISEPLYPHQRVLMRQVLGDVAFAPFYGLSEKAAFAAEVEGDEDVYEFNPLYGVAELLDDSGRALTDIGGEGRIVGTGFLSTGMPFIRYDTGDFARLVQPATAENGYRLRVAAIAPRRKPGFLITTDGERVVATDLTPEDPEFFSGIAEYQFHQDTPGIVAMRYIKDANGSDDDAKRLVDAFTSKVVGKIRFQAEEVEKIITGRGGKRAFIDQRLPLDLY